MAAEAYSNEAILRKACGQGTVLNRETGKCEVVSPKYSNASAAAEVESVKCSSGIRSETSKMCSQTELKITQHTAKHKVWHRNPPDCVG